MKITYPECQIDITAEEVITLIDHFKIEVTSYIEPSIDPDVIKEEVYQFFKHYKPRSHEKEKRTTD